MPLQPQGMSGGVEAHVQRPFFVLRYRPSPSRHALGRSGHVGRLQDPRAHSLPLGRPTSWVELRRDGSKYIQPPCRMSLRWVHTLLIRVVVVSDYNFRAHTAFEAHAARVRRLRDRRGLGEGGTPPDGCALGNQHSQPVLLRAHAVQTPLPRDGQR